MRLSVAASMRATWPTSTFSFMDSRRSSRATARTSGAPSPSSSTADARSSTKDTNPSDLAEKSVSHLRWTRAARSVVVASPMAPSALSRSERPTALARPCSRKAWAAASWSPLASTRARFASIIPAPVASRRAFTSRAATSTMIKQAPQRQAPQRQAPQRQAPQRARSNR